MAVHIQRSCTHFQRWPRVFFLCHQLCSDPDSEEWFERQMIWSAASFWDLCIKACWLKANLKDTGLASLFYLFFSFCPSYSYLSGAAYFLLYSSPFLSLIVSNVFTSSNKLCLLPAVNFFVSNSLCVQVGVFTGSVSTEISDRRTTDYCIFQIISHIKQNKVK